MYYVVCKCFQFVPVKKNCHLVKGLMPLDGVLLSEMNYKAAEGVEQDQTARMCRLILIHTIRKSIVSNGRTSAHNTISIDRCLALVAQC